MKAFNKNLLIKILCVTIFVCAVIGAVVFLVLSVEQKPKENIPQTDYVIVSYSFDEKCCELIGSSHQFIVKGDDAEPVTLKPKLGYFFMGWATVDNQNEYFDKDKFTRQELNVQENISLIAKFIGPVESYVVFRAGKGGTVEGKLEQTVIYGGEGTPVTAIPDEGYRFVKWSDGETEAERKNQSIKHYYVDTSDVYAEFERYSRKFEYVYNDGVSAEGETEIEITIDNIDNLILPVPERANCNFEGWYSDWHHEVQVADSNGNIVVCEDWLKNDDLYHYSTNPEGYLYAKWSTKEELPTYKILMIYITEVHGDFWIKSKTSSELEYTKVDYVMTEKHRKICTLITEFMSKYLNAIFNETVRFQVDEYFTTEPLNENVFNYNGVNWGSGPDVIASNGVQETKDIIKEYDSVLTSFSLCGYENNFKLTGGVGGSARAGGKYATVVLDYALKFFADSDIDKLTDFSYGGFFTWECIMDSYIHEYIHTIEGLAVVMDNVGLHSALSYDSKYGDNNSHGYNVYIPFLLNKFEVDNGEYWGIPGDFWLRYKS